MVYRSNGDQMDYQPLSPEPIGNNFYLDTFDFGTGYTQAYHYMVKAVALQTTPTGSYYNQSVGVITNDGIQAPPLAADIVTTPYYNCAGYDGTIVVNTTGGNPPYCITYDPPVNPDYVPEGIYTVTIVDENGNAFVDTAIVGSVGQTTVLTIYSTGPACLGYTTTYYNSSQEVHNSWDITGGHIVYDGDNTINVVWDVLGPGLVSFYGYTSLGGCGSVGELEVIVDSCIVATSQPDVEVVRFYPNPATDILTIDFPDGMAGSVSAYLTDIHGRKVLEQLLVAEKTEIPIAHLPPGVYEVVVTKKNIMYIEKLVKL
jgi:hypothetical protein